MSKIYGPGSVAVIGGGWAGCAAAADLAATGRRVLLLEAGRELGGRGRRVELELDGAAHVLDNGQHLMLGAFSETAALLAQLGVPLDSVIARQPFEIFHAHGLRLRAGRWPAPWHLAVALLTARSLSLTDRIALASFLPRARRQSWKVDPDREATGWLSSMRQTPELIANLWRPLCVAALNTPIERASAQILANVLRESLGADAPASEMWLPRTDLSSLMPEAAERLIVRNGGEVRLAARVDLARYAPESARWSLAVRTRGEHTAVEVESLVYAAAPLMLPRVFGLHAEALRPALRLIERFRYEPIVTTYLKYSPETRLPRPMVALADDAPDRRYGQWVFDRGALDPRNAGVLAAVISAGGPHEDEPLDRLGEVIGWQLREELGLPAPRAVRTIVERRATLAATPGLQRPSNATSLPKL
ncbi:MAG: hydroxysqualene dehydroxylase HpnE, partial [Burkholderiaceae bacterium]